METIKYYVNKWGSQYRVIYTTPKNNAVPTLESWTVLALQRKALLDFSGPQQIVTIPTNLVDKYYLGAESPNDRK